MSAEKIKICTLGPRKNENKMKICMGGSTKKKYVRGVREFSNSAPPSGSQTEYPGSPNSITSSICKIELLLLVTVKTLI